MYCTIFDQMHIIAVLYCILFTHAESSTRASSAGFEVFFVDVSELCFVLDSGLFLDSAVLWRSLHQDQVHLVHHDHRTKN